MSTLTFWIDVDNTLIANDEVKKNLDEHLQVELGSALAQRFWDIYEEVRQEESLVDIPLSLKRLRAQVGLTEMDERTYLHVCSIFENYPFTQALYPHALETLHHLRIFGKTVIVSDGDLDFQAEKIFSSTLAEATEGRVLLYKHKQDHLEEVQQRYPADHYAMIDDKPQILADAKKIMGEKLTTVFVKQGKYAVEPLPEGFVPDVNAENIGELRHYSKEQFFK